MPLIDQNTYDYDVELPGVEEEVEEEEEEQAVEVAVEYQEQGEEEVKEDDPVDDDDQKMPANADPVLLLVWCTINFSLSFSGLKSFSGV